MPASLVLFLLVPGDPESGAAYVLDRNSGTWYAVDFEDLQYGGYSVTQLETLLKDCSSLISWNGRGFGALGCHGGGTLGPRQKRPFDRKNIPGYLPAPTHEKRRGKEREMSSECLEAERR